VVCVYAGASSRRAMRSTTSRLDENRTTHAADFRNSDQVYLKNDDSVSVIDTASRLVTATIALGTGNHIPTAIAASPLGAIWVACNTSSSVVVIDPTSNTVAHSTDLGLGNGPTGIAFAA
jgi:YVTN family beta-propeller protein